MAAEVDLAGGGEPAQAKHGSLLECPAILRHDKRRLRVVHLGCSLLHQRGGNVLKEGEQDTQGGEGARWRFELCPRAVRSSVASLESCIIKTLLRQPPHWRKRSRENQEHAIAEGERQIEKRRRRKVDWCLSARKGRKTEENQDGKEQQDQERMTPLASTTRHSIARYQHAAMNTNSTCSTAASLTKPSHVPQTALMRRAQRSGLASLARHNHDFQCSSTS